MSQAVASALIISGIRKQKFVLTAARARILAKNVQECTGILIPASLVFLVARLVQIERPAYSVSPHFPSHRTKPIVRRFVRPNFAINADTIAKIYVTSVSQTTIFQEVKDFVA
jgi:hypothetical protein